MITSLDTTKGRQTLHNLLLLLVLLFCDVTLQWPGRAASFESQASCPSPKPPQTPWGSQVEWWHHTCKKKKQTKTCLFRVAGKFCCLWIYCEHVVWNFSYMFIQVFCVEIVSLRSFEFQFLKCSTELAMHSTHCHSVQDLVFHSSALKFLERLYLQTCSQTTWMVGLTARPPQWVTCSCFNLFSILSNIFLAQGAL